MQPINDTLPALLLKKMTTYQTLDNLCRESVLGKRADFDEFLKRVPDVPSLVGDAFFEQSTEKQQLGSAPCQN